MKAPEPIVVTEFKSKRSFWISDARNSDLVLRSPGGMFNPINIDIIFRAVLYIEMPFSLTGIRVTQPCDQKALELEERFCKYRCVADNYLGELVYAIESDGGRYHVVASTACVHVNTLPEDRLPLWFLEDADSKDEADYFRKYVKEYYRIEKEPEHTT